MDNIVKEETNNNKKKKMFIYMRHVRTKKTLTQR